MVKGLVFSLKQFSPLLIPTYLPFFFCISKEEERSSSLAKSRKAGVLIEQPASWFFINVRLSQDRSLDSLDWSPGGLLKSEESAPKPGKSSDFPPHVSFLCSVSQSQHSIFQSHHILNQHPRMTQTTTAWEPSQDAQWGHSINFPSNLIQTQTQFNLRLVGQGVRRGGATGLEQVLGKSPSPLGPSPPEMGQL